MYGKYRTQCTVALNFWQRLSHLHATNQKVSHLHAHTRSLTHQKFKLGIWVSLKSEFCVGDSLHSIAYHSRESKDMLVAIPTNGFLPFQGMYEGLVASSDGDNMHMGVCVSKER